MNSECFDFTIENNKSVSCWSESVFSSTLIHVCLSIFQCINYSYLMIAHSKRELEMRENFSLESILTKDEEPECKCLLYHTTLWWITCLSCCQLDPSKAVTHKSEQIHHVRVPMYKSLIQGKNPSFKSLLTCSSTEVLVHKSKMSSRRTIQLIKGFRGIVLSFMVTQNNTFQTTWQTGFDSWGTNLVCVFWS